MKKIIVILLIMFSFFNKASANYSKLAYDFQFEGLDGQPIKLENYKNKVL